MRIVAGDLRGRLLVAPKGHSTRPTADRTRQALFNVLEHAAWAPGLHGRRVLDLFAGSGALGLEALSRGADFCLFVDRDEAARTAIFANLRALSRESAARVLAGDATAMGPAPAEGPFDLVFLDPPYGQGLAAPALASLLGGVWLTRQALVVVERGAGEGAFVAPGFRRVDARSWGAARVDVLTPDDSAG